VVTAPAGLSAQFRVAELRAQLAEPTATLPERLLAERVALCWLDVYSLDIQAMDERHSLNTITYHDRRRNAAQRRYLSSLRALATIRKPAAPAVQVNQLNMGAGGINLPALEREEDGLRPTCPPLPWEARQLGAPGSRNGRTAHQPA
jgi:hypothetical protein